MRIVAALGSPGAAAAAAASAAAATPVATPPAPVAPPPRAVPAARLTSALATLRLAPSELTLLYLQRENNRLGAAAARSMVQAYGELIAAEHHASQEQLQRAIAAAGHKSWWQQLLTVFQVIGVAATVASGGTIGALVGALMVTALLIERRHPRAALGLNLAAVGLLAGNAGARLVAALAGNRAVATSGAALKAASTGVAAGAGGGAALGRGMVGAYAAAELRADAARLRHGALLEQARQQQREEVAVLKTLGAADQRDTHLSSEIAARRHDTTAAALRV